MKKTNWLVALVIVIIPQVAVAQNVVDLVYPQLDSENSRWFFFNSASRPLGMVNLSPDTQIGGAWGSGYRYNTDTVKGFSHIHAWQLAGLSVMPVTNEAKNNDNIFIDFYSHFHHEIEKAEVGYHYLKLERYNIEAELASTQRVGFHRYTFPEKHGIAILFNLNGTLGPSEMTGGFLQKTGDFSLSGKVVNEPTRRRPKPTTVFFWVEFNSKIESVEKDDKTGNYLVELRDSIKSPVLMKAAISYTSEENAKLNMTTELPGWDFDAVVSNSKEEWNELLGRIKIEGGSKVQQRRFYTDLWHGLLGRRMINDVNGAYPDNTGEKFRIGKLPLDENGNPKFNHYNSDSFWGAQWTLNTLWGLVYPEIYEEFVYSLMQYYRDGGLVPRGPSGGNYTYVMTGASSTPFVVSAIQKGIVKDNHETIYRALKENHMPGGIMSKAGYEHKTNKGGGLEYFMENGYVPHPNPDGMRFGFHQNGPGMTLEYAFQDWTLAQLAKKLGHNKDYSYFMKRSKNYKNVFDTETGFMRPKNIQGEWLPDFDPNVGPGFVEANAAQGTWFVTQDIPGLAELMGGKEAATKKLNHQFEVARELDFTAGKAHDQETENKHKRIPINYGNQPSIQTAFIFHHLNRPDLSQYWSKKVVEQAFSGFSTNSGYNGDEDQGLMGSLAVLMKLGLFQLQSGADKESVYQIGSPLFKKATIRLNPNYYPGEKIEIEVENPNAKKSVVRSAKWNGAEIKDFEIPHSQLIGGGKMVLEFK